MQQIIRTCVVCLLLGFSAAMPASDLAKEKRWADQVIEALLDGEAITLNDGKTGFLGILTETVSEKPAGGAIVLHGSGVHPDWPQVVHPLRVRLTAHGWTTLSLQLPVLANEAEYKDYIPVIPDAASRIQAGIKHLQSMGLKRIVIIAHSLGTVMAGHALANGLTGVDAYVAVGMPDGAIQYLDKISIPTLDLYGQNDLENIVKSAPQRRQASSHNKAYRQVASPGADHFFNEKDDQLLATVIAWLEKR